MQTLRTIKREPIAAVPPSTFFTVPTKQEQISARAEDAQDRCAIDDAREEFSEVATAGSASCDDGYEPIRFLATASGEELAAWKAKLLMRRLTRRTGSANGSQPPAISPFTSPTLLRINELVGRRADPIPFIVDRFLPAGEVTLLAGHGGAGKSTVALHLAVCMALGKPFHGNRCERRRVAYLSCEDDARVLHVRLERIIKYLGCEMADLDGWLTPYDAANADCILFSRPRSGDHRDTKTYDWVAAQMKNAGVQVIIVDGVADAFDGDENSRSEVKRFVRGIRRLIPNDGAALLLSHVNKSTAKNGKGERYSGSTGWHNSVRARWYLGYVSGNEKRGQLILEVEKLNTGAAGASIYLRWSDEHQFLVYERSDKTQKAERSSNEARNRDWIVAQVGAIRLEGDHCPAAATGPRTAVSVLLARPGCPQDFHGRLGRKLLASEIETLRQTKRLKSNFYKDDGRRVREELVVDEVPREDDGARPEDAVPCRSASISGCSNHE
jgi:hypothetical protein